MSKSDLRQGDCLELMKDMPDGSVDAIITDPPYGYSFMGKDWDKAVPSVEIWQECLRVLKPGAFACVMSAPRSDVQQAMTERLIKAGFRLDFTPIYWTYASGFPKAMNIGKAAEGKVLTGSGNKQAFQKLEGEKAARGNWGISKMSKDHGFRPTDYSADTSKERTLKVDFQTEEGAALDGSYAGFQPKPALEVCITARKPLSKEQELTIITSQLIEVLSWLNVQLAANSSSLHQTVKDSIVPRLATGSTDEEVITQAGQVAELSGQMATLKSTLEQTAADQFTSWNIVTLWQSILADLLRHMNKYTTETMIALITDLRTLSYLLSTSIPDNTTQADEMTLSGFQLNVDTVESVLRSVLTKSLSPSQATAQKSAGSKNLNGEEVRPASGAVQTLEVTTRKESIAHSPATPHPEVSVAIIAMKPLSEKTYVDQALKNRKGITWLDDCRVPTGEKLSGGSGRVGGFAGKEDEGNKGLSDYRVQGNDAGRFPANLLVSDDVLNDGRIIKSTGPMKHDYREQNNDNPTRLTKNIHSGYHPNDSGSYSRYFDLDKWAAAHLTEQQMQTFPFAIFPKASKSEKNKGLEHLDEKLAGGMSGTRDGSMLTGSGNVRNNMAKNHHPTVKPLKLMSYLITLFSREGDTVLDPFMGSGTTGVAAKNLNRNFIGIELDETYLEIAKIRIEAEDQNEPTN